jgi:hypothetical protein
MKSQYNLGFLFQPKTMKCSNAKRHMTEEPHGHTGLFSVMVVQTWGLPSIYRNVVML